MLRAFSLNVRLHVEVVRVHTQLLLVKKKSEPFCLRELNLMKFLVFVVCMLLQLFRVPREV